MFDKKKREEEKLRAAILRSIDEGNRPLQYSLSRELTRRTCPRLWKMMTTVVAKEK